MPPCNQPPTPSHPGARLLRTLTFCKFSTSTFWIYLPVSMREGCLAGSLHLGEPSLQNGKEQPATLRAYILLIKIPEPEHGLQAVSSASCGGLWQNSGSQENTSTARSWSTACQNNITRWTLEVTPVLLDRNDINMLCSLQSTFSGLSGGYSQCRSFPLQLGENGLPAASWGRGEVVPRQRLFVHEAVVCQGGRTMVNHGGADSGRPCQGTVPLPGHAAL